MQINHSVWRGWWSQWLVKKMGGGIVSCNLLGLLAKAMPIARHGTVRVATYHVPCSSYSDVYSPLAFKTKTVKSMFVNKFSAHSSGSQGFVHAKPCTRIGCWNVRTLGSLSDQCSTLCSFRYGEVQEHGSSYPRWVSVAGSGVFSICDSTILHLGSPFSHTHGVVIILSPCAKAAWDGAGCVFQPVSERILRLHLKCHMFYMTVVAVYALTNPPNSTFEAVSPSKTVVHQLHSTLSSVPSSDLLVIFGDFNAHVGSDFSSWNSVIGSHGVEECNKNGEWLLNPTTNLLCLLCASKSRPSIDTQGHHATKPWTIPLLTRLATSWSWLNPLTSLISPSPSTLNGTALNHPSKRLVSHFHLHLEVMTLTGSLMKYTTCPERRKKLGLVWRMHHSS